MGPSHPPGSAAGQCAQRSRSRDFGRTATTTAPSSSTSTPSTTVRVRTPPQSRAKQARRGRRSPLPHGTNRRSPPLRSALFCSTTRKQPSAAGPAGCCSRRQAARRGGLPSLLHSSCSRLSGYETAHVARQTTSAVEAGSRPERRSAGSPEQSRETRRSRGQERSCGQFARNSRQSALRRELRAVGGVQP